MGSSHFPNDHSITVVLSVNVWPGSRVDVIMSKSPSIDCHSLLYSGNSKQIFTFQRDSLDGEPAFSQACFGLVPKVTAFHPHRQNRDLLIFSKIFYDY